MVQTAVERERKREMMESIWKGERGENLQNEGKKNKDKERKVDES